MAWDILMTSPHNLVESVHKTSSSNIFILMQHFVCTEIGVNVFIFTDTADLENNSNDVWNINPQPDMTQEYAMQSHIAQTAFPA